MDCVEYRKIFTEENLPPPVVRYNPCGMQQPVGGLLGFLGRLRAEKLQYSDFSVGYILLDHYAAKYNDNMLQPFSLVSGYFGSIALYISSVDRLGNIVKFTQQKFLPIKVEKKRRVSHSTRRKYRGVLRRLRCVWIGLFWLIFR